MNNYTNSPRLGFGTIVLIKDESFIEPRKRFFHLLFGLFLTHCVLAHTNIMNVRGVAILLKYEKKDK